MQALYHKTADIECHELPDGFILYNPADDSVHFLNHTAMIIWELCTGQYDSEQIEAQVAELYSMEELPRMCVPKTLDDMVAKGLIAA